MTNAINDIFKQANQGSVAAIIQVLNEKLVDSGVRTRAVLVEGILQLLCEAATAEQLEQATLVEQIREILEAISPRGIRRVNVNGRIVREQQLLWLEEISRDPKNQLLWSQEIALKQPNFFQKILNVLKSDQHDAPKSMFPTRSPRQMREQRQFRRGGLIGGAAVSLLLLAGWGIYARFISTPETPTPTPAKTTEPIPKPSPTNQAKPPTPQPSPTVATSSSPSTPTADPFARAVWLAEQASVSGQTAKTAAEWLALAARWQEASDLMATVPESDKRYQTAQDRVTAYRNNRAIALQKAQEQN